MRIHSRSGGGGVFLKEVSDWPVYAGSDLSIGSLKSQVGIVTLWTKKSEVLKHLSKSDYCVAGQLYNAYNGISYLIRNCLANKNVRYLILTGEDLSNTGEALKNLFEEGVNDDYCIKGMPPGFKIHEEVPVSKVRELTSNVELLDYRGLEDFSKLKEVINDLEELGSYGEGEVFPAAEVNTVVNRPSEEAGFVVRSESIGEAWLEALNTVVKFGCLKDTEYSDEQLEVVDLVIVTDEDVNNIDFKDYYLFNEEDLQDYFPKILTANSYEGVEYTYGQRLRDYQSIDQVNEVIKKLEDNESTRRAVTITWNVVKDLNSDKAPCINLLQFLVQEGSVFLTAYIRSNDMFKAWPLNAYGLRKLQDYVAGGLGLSMGKLTTISCSAHVYKSDLSQVMNVVEENEYETPSFYDERGNYVIKIESDEIVLTHLSPSGMELNQYAGVSAERLSKEVINDLGTSDVTHALYLGRELQRAEHALENDEDYVQR